jgi:hypothetical protein
MATITAASLSETTALFLSAAKANEAETKPAMRRRFLIMVKSFEGKQGGCVEADE